MKVCQVAELISDNVLIIETMDAECRCVDYGGEDIDQFMEYEVQSIFAYGDIIYLRIEV